MLQFTKELKEKWLRELKSGKYIQAFVAWQGIEIDGKEQRCCIAVLDKVLGQNDGSVWRILNEIDTETSTKLITTNDDLEYRKTGKRDYSNVIPIIEQLPTVD